MADDTKEKESKLRIEQMPSVVQHLLNTMLSLDPNFKLEEWLEQKAKEDLELLNRISKEKKFS